MQEFGRYGLFEVPLGMWLPLHIIALMLIQCSSRPFKGQDSRKFSLYPRTRCGRCRIHNGGPQPRPAGYFRSSPVICGGGGVTTLHVHRHVQVDRRSHVARCLSTPPRNNRRGAQLSHLAGHFLPAGGRQLFSRWLTGNLISGRALWNAGFPENTPAPAALLVSLWKFLRSSFFTHLS